jgi:hypothetical protein
MGLMSFIIAKSGSEIKLSLVLFCFSVSLSWICYLTFLPSAAGKHSKKTLPTGQHLDIGLPCIQTCDRKFLFSINYLVYGILFNSTK